MSLVIIISILYIFHNVLMPFVTVCKVNTIDFIKHTALNKKKLPNCK